MHDLIEAIVVDNVMLVKELLDSGIDPNGYVDHARVRPLHFAAQYNAMKSARVLLRAGADSELETDDGITPIQIASARFDQEMVSLFLSGKDKQPLNLVYYH
jgi:ankyrin repeat protein